MWTLSKWIVCAQPPIAPKNMTLYCQNELHALQQSHAMVATNSSVWQDITQTRQNLPTYNCEHLYGHLYGQSMFSSACTSALFIKFPPQLSCLLCKLTSWQWQAASWQLAAYNAGAVKWCRLLAMAYKGIMTVRQETWPPSSAWACWARSWTPEEQQTAVPHALISLYTLQNF